MHTAGKLVVADGPGLASTPEPVEPTQILRPAAYIEAARGTDTSMATLRLSDSSVPLMGILPSPEGQPFVLGLLFNRSRDVVISYLDKGRSVHGLSATEYTATKAGGGHIWDQDRDRLGCFLIGSPHESNVWRVRSSENDHSGRLVFTLQRLSTLDAVQSREEVKGVSTPTLRITSEVVERALNDAATLIRSNGAVSGLDRLHTVFHGYLKAICEDAGLLVSDDSSITELFKLVRKKHPSISGLMPGAKHVDRILSAMATIVDALNPVRNRGSVAHPNEELLEEPEATLVINSIRTLLHYLNSRVRKT